MKVRPIIWAVNLVLLVVLGYWGTETFMARRGDERDAPPPAQPSRAKSPVASAPRPSPDLARLAENSLFGKTQEPVPPKAVTPPKTAPANTGRTQLALKLLGTVAGDPLIARAVIEDTRTRAQDIYKIDDMVQGGRLIKIGADRVVLQVDDRQEVLAMQFVGDLAKSPVTTRPTPPRPTPRLAAGRHATEGHPPSGHVARRLIWTSD